MQETLERLGALFPNWIDVYRQLRPDMALITMLARGYRF